jgi:ribA/ribD-fused uncharacterized protein
MSYNLKWLTDKFDKGETIKYIFFWGHTNKDNEDIGKFVLSQWFYSPFVVDEVEYKTTEHWMMAHKAKLFGDNEAFEKIVKAEKPGEVKEIGRQIRGFDDIKWTTGNLKLSRPGIFISFIRTRN